MHYELGVSTYIEMCKDLLKQKYLFLWLKIN